MPDPTDPPDSTEPLRHHTISAADGVPLHTLDAGPLDGDPVLLVHGWPDTHQVWRNQIAPLTAAGHRVIAHDQRGFGASGRPDDLAGYHVFNAMADLGSILDALDIESAHLVAHDWGAPPCWLAAAFSPERVTSLTAMSVGHPSAFRNAGIEQRQRSFYMLLFQFVDIAETWLRADDWANMRTLIADPPDWPERRSELERPGALTSSLNWYRANIAPETLIEPPTELPPISVPTMGVMGADDWALLPEQMTSSEQYVTGQWRYEVIDSAAHRIQTEQPHLLNALLVDFFAEVSSVGSPR